MVSVMDSGPGPDLGYTTPFHVPATVLMSDTATGRTGPALMQPTRVVVRPTMRTVRTVPSDRSAVRVVIGALHRGPLIVDDLRRPSLPAAAERAVVLAWEIDATPAITCCVRRLAGARPDARAALVSPAGRRAQAGPANSTAREGQPSHRDRARQADAFEEPHIRMMHAELPKVHPRVPYPAPAVPTSCTIATFQVEVRRGYRVLGPGRTRAVAEARSNHGDP